MMQFTQGLHRSVQQHPQMIATVCGGRRQTFQQQAERVSRLAGGLASVGISKGDRVAILSLNSDHYLECYLAIAWLGAVVNPANFRWSNAEVVYSLNDSESSVLIVDAHFADQAEEIQRGASCVKHLLYIGDGDTPEGMIGAESLIRDNPPIADTEAGNDDLFGIFYTGGTTGAPKGVMLSHRNIFSSALALLAEGLLPEGAIGMHNAPMFHLADMMLTTGLLIRGGSHVFLPAF
ncbi:MAG: AMP-binding protein, partial [Spongiibacter sp.]